MAPEYSAQVSRILEEAQSVLATDFGRRMLAAQYERAAAAAGSADSARLARAVASRLREQAA